MADTCSVICGVALAVCFIVGDIAMIRFRHKAERKRRVDSEDVQWYWRWAKVSAVFFALASGSITPMVLPPVDTTASSFLIVFVLLVSVGGAVKLISSASIVNKTSKSLRAREVIHDLEARPASKRLTRTGRG